MIMQEQISLGAAGADGATGVDAALACALADELVALTSALAELAYDLGSNDEVLRRHMGSLQAVDRITQVQLAIADVLRSGSPSADRLASVTLESLAASLEAAYAGYLEPDTPSS